VCTSIASSSASASRHLPPEAHAEMAALTHTVLGTSVTSSARRIARACSHRPAGSQAAMAFEATKASSRPPRSWSSVISRSATDHTPPRLHASMALAYDGE
jgi:hypothetical protein